MQQERPQRPVRKRARRDGPLKQYRLYFQHSEDKHFSHSHEFETESDERAIAIAEGWREGRRAELWTGARKLKTWEPERER